MRKEKNKRGKCPRNKIIQRVKVPENKIEVTYLGELPMYNRVKNDHPKVGRNILIYHQKI